MISDDSMFYLAKMVKSINLDRLNINLRKNSISDKGMLVLCSEMKECRNLGVLNLESDLVNIEEKKKKYIQYYLQLYIDSQQ